MKVGLECRYSTKCIRHIMFSCQMSVKTQLVIFNSVLKLWSVLCWKLNVRLKNCHKVEISSLASLLDKASCEVVT